MPHGDWDQLSKAQTAALWALFRTPGGQGREHDIRPKVRISTWAALQRYSLVSTVGHAAIRPGTVVRITRSGMEHIGIDPEAR